MNAKQSTKQKNQQDVAGEDASATETTVDYLRISEHGRHPERVE